MNIKPKIYLETTLFNYYFLQDETRQADIDATQKLFIEMKQGKFLGYVSAVCLKELESCPDINLRNKMLGLITESQIKDLQLKNYVQYEDLAQMYILAGAIPRIKVNDALHIAIAVLTNMDILASWNCDHIVRFKTQQIIEAVNALKGFDNIAINTPREIISYEKNQK